MAQADEMIRSFGFALPPFAYWSPETFKRNAAAARPIIDAQCGWDITDYGAGNFEAMGLFCSPCATGAWLICSAGAACAMRKNC